MMQLCMYPFPVASGCAGQAEAVEFCFRRTVGASNFEMFLSLLKLIENTTNLVIIEIFQINITVPNHCIESNDTVCCDTVSISFALPTLADVIGVSLFDQQRSRLLEYNNSQYQVDGYAATRIRFINDSVNSRFLLQVIAGTLVDLNLRVLRFVVRRTDVSIPIRSTTMSPELYASSTTLQLRC